MAASTLLRVNALNKVDLPTLGRPTIPEAEAHGVTSLPERPRSSPLARGTPGHTASPDADRTGTVSGVPAQRKVGQISAPHSPVHGVPWWGAVLIAVSMTLAGLAIEAGWGHQELGSPFAIAYALGCVLAVLAVRRSGIFTAVIQPLLLFVAVPLAYYLLHNSAFSGLKGGGDHLRLPADRAFSADAVHQLGGPADRTDPLVPGDDTSGRRAGSGCRTTAAAS